MTTNEKKDLIRKFEQKSNSFDDVPELSEDLILFRPFDGAWSIIEQIVHCLDFEIANFHRYRWSIVKPGTKVLSFDSQWTVTLNYQACDAGSAIDAIKTVRKFMALHLTMIIEDDWKEYKYTLGEERTFDLEEALKLYIDHVDFHRDLIDRNIKLYNGCSNKYSF